MSMETTTPNQLFAASQAAAWVGAVPEDETLYSSLARLHRACGFHRAESSSQFLLGHSQGAALIGVPAGLSRLADLTSGAITATEATLRARTVLGPYLALMPQVRRNMLISHCLDSNPGRAAIGAGLFMNRVAPHQPLRLCDVCLREQSAEIGFGYWLVAHQWPGSWICEKHRTLLRHVPIAAVSSKRWLSVEACITGGLLKSLEISPDIASSLERIGACIRWIAGRASVHPDVLQVLARERLVARGHLRNEASCSQQEYESVHFSLTAPIAASGIPDFIGFRDGRWVRQVLVDRRNLHPLRWAVLLASDGPVDMGSLDVAYLSAASRVPQPSLFEESQRRRSCAPYYIYRAFAAPGTLSEIASLSGLRRRELEAWLRKDPELGVYRRRMSDEARRQDSRRTIEIYLREHSDAFRSQVIRDCLRAVRWLGTNDPELLDALLPAVQPKYTRQKRLDLRV